MSALAKDLIRRLLVVNPSDRLGAVFGDIEAHPWFDGVEWDCVVTRNWERSPALDVGLGMDNIERADEVAMMSKEVGVSKNCFIYFLEKIQTDCECYEKQYADIMCSSEEVVDPLSEYFIDF